MFSLPNQPQSIGRTLDTGFKLYFGGLRKIILFALVASIVGAAPGIMMLTSIDTAAVMSADQIPAAGIGTMILVMLVNLVMMAAIILRLGRYAEGEDIPIGETLRVALKCLLPLFLGSICYVIAVALGFLALLIPGIILSLSMMFYSMAIVLDNEGVFSGLKRSHKLVWGDWWRTATVLFVPGMIIMVLYIGLAMVVGGGATFSIMSTGTPDFESMLQIQLYMTIGQAVLNSVVTPLIYAVMVVQYHDLKMRKEGSDLEVRIAGGVPA